MAKMAQNTVEVKRGRPTEYNAEIADKIIDIISTSNRSLASICKELDLNPSTIYRWLDSHKEFCDNYARAKEWQADFMAEEILEIADDATNDFMTITKGYREYEVENKEVISRSRLRVESRKWLASKLKPKKYADTIKAEITNPDGSFSNLGNLSTEELLARAQAAKTIESAKKSE